MTDVRRINRDLCQALGVEDVDQVQSVVLVVAPDALPTITVTRIVRDTEGLKVVCGMHRLRPDRPTLSVVEGGSA
jgi:uncharacterized membrane protein YjjP (DUF1212 family)